MSHLTRADPVAKPPLRVRFFPRSRDEVEWQYDWREQQLREAEEQSQRQRDMLKKLIATMEQDLRAKSEKDQSRKREREVSIRPPALAEVILYACTKRRYRSSIVGDRAEIFADDVRRRGRATAVRFYWTDAAKSLLPLLNRIMPWAIAGEALRRWLGS